MSVDREAFLAEAKDRAGTNPIEVSVRDLLNYWGAKRRGYWIVEQIRNSLEAHGLQTTPPFVDVWIGSSVKIVPLQPQDVLVPIPEVDTVKKDQGAPAEIFLRVGSLRSANSGVVSVSPQDEVSKAQSLMLRYGYSQLAILSGERDLRGAVSWESISHARIRGVTTALADVTVTAEVVREDDDLLAQIPRIIDAGFVFVQAKDKRIRGIVTTADLSEEFSRTANPFFIIGEIERRLRAIIDDVFSPNELAEIADPEDVDRTVGEAADLTFGEYQRLLENPGRWSRLNWHLDRKVFIDALDEVREIRNDIMHFSPDPLDEESVAKLRRFAQWLRKLMA
ncbi:CBS domain-containing protein [Micromonospora marina]|uniref:CBS domain-containing protein n=1 Tax=Micromonospora marina TaxID=307120 RepID=UPI00114D3B27|nr:CBS domain-containing protein [Micromonospora marina]